VSTRQGGEGRRRAHCEEREDVDAHLNGFVGGRENEDEETDGVREGELLMNSFEPTTRSHNYLRE
jgi:hypothetical protein